MGVFKEPSGTSLQPLGTFPSSRNRGGFEVGEDGTLVFNPEGDEDVIAHVDFPSNLAVNNTSIGRVVEEKSDSTSAQVVDIFREKKQ